MCQQTVIDRTGQARTGRLVDHLGNGLAEVDVDGKRYVGRKVESCRQASR